MYRNRSAAAVLAVTVVTGVVGCGATHSSPIAPDPVADALGEVGQMLRFYGNDKGRAPTRPADLAGCEPGFPSGYEAVRKGDIVVVWGARMLGEDQTGEPSEVIAYEKATPTAGGHALMTNGTVKKLSASEFAAVPKAKKK